MGDLEEHQMHRFTDKFWETQEKSIKMKSDNCENEYAVMHRDNNTDGWRRTSII